MLPMLRTLQRIFLVEEKGSGGVLWVWAPVPFAKGPSSLEQNRPAPF